MEILEFNNKFHIIQNNLVYGSFFHKVEAEEFLKSVQEGKLKPLTDKELLRLLTVEQLKAGETMKPIDNIEEFKFIP